MGWGKEGEEVQRGYTDKTRVLILEYYIDNFEARFIRKYNFPPHFNVSQGTILKQRPLHWLKPPRFFRRFGWLLGFLCSICKGEFVDQGFRGSEVLVAGDEYLKGILKSAWASWLIHSWYLCINKPENWAWGMQRVAITSVVSLWWPRLNVFPSKAFHGWM